VETIAPVQMQRLGNSVPWALVALILIYGATSAQSTAAKVGGFAAAALMTLVSWRSARMRLLLGDEVVIVGWFHSTRIPWREVDRFDVNTRGLYVKQVGGLETQVPAFSSGGSLIKAMKASQQAELQGVAARAEKSRKERQRNRNASPGPRPKGPPKPPPGKRRPRA
jgi:hypothetical protein